MVKYTQANLWGDEFVVPEDNTKDILKKLKSPKKVETDINKLLKSKKTPLETKLKLIDEEVTKILGHYKNETLVIRDKQTFVDYIAESIKNGVIAIDTETLSNRYLDNGQLDPDGSLDPITCLLAGPCIYTPSLKQAYIPINHLDINTGERLENQLTEEDVKEQFQRLVDDKNIKIIFHNYKFDYKVIKCTCGVELPCYWDTIIGAKMIDENERAGLKHQYVSKIDPNQAKYDIEHLFAGVTYAQVDPDLFALYAATDSMMTYKLYLYQKEILESKELESMYNIFMNVEMPLVKVVANMELRGMRVDKEYCERISKKYHKEQEKVIEEVNHELRLLKPQIDAWKLTKEALIKEGKKTKLEQLSDPINLSSPSQLAILLFDILKIPEGLSTYYKDGPRSTGSNALKAITDKYNLGFLDALMKQRKMEKLVNSFVDALPRFINPKDGRIHTNFNQLGALARFSSSDPNLQQLPSRTNKDVRCMLQVDEGKVLIGADFSAAEVRAAVQACQDPGMIDAYNSGRDLYSVVGSAAFNVSYEDAMEFYPEGTEITYEGKKVITGYRTHTNKSGKEIRSASKSILLGSMYGRGAASIAVQIGRDKKEGQGILDNLFKGFPKLKEWQDTTMSTVAKYGYIDDPLGRRRHLPDAILPKYEIRSKNHASELCNPFLECANNLVDPTKASKYLNALEKSKSYRDYNSIVSSASKDGLEIINNQSKIARAKREALNWCCQAQAATWIKLCLLAIDRDPIMNELGGELLLTIHDEIQMQAPIENAEKAKERLEFLMSDAIKDILCIQMPTDGTIEWSGKWYMTEIETLINDHFNRYRESGLSEEEAYNRICEEESQLLPENIYNFLFNHEYLR